MTDSIGKPPKPALETLKFETNGKTIEFEGTKEQVGKLQKLVDQGSALRNAQGLPVLSYDEFISITRKSNSFDQNAVARALDVALNGGVKLRANELLAEKVVAANKSTAPGTPNQLRQQAIKDINDLLLSGSEAFVNKTLGELGLRRNDKALGGAETQAVIGLIKSLELPPETKLGLLTYAQNVHLARHKGVSAAEAFSRIGDFGPYEASARNLRNDVAIDFSKQTFPVQLYKALEDAKAELK